MKIENTSSGKIIGIGEVSVLPGETKEIPEAYETSPILEVYRKQGFAKITGKPKVVQKATKRLLRRRRRRRQKHSASLALHRWKASARRTSESWRMNSASILLSARTRLMY